MSSTPEPSLKVYGNPLSQPTRSVLLLVKSAGFPFTFEAVDTMAGAHKTPEYKALNPAGLVPVINDDGFLLAESAAILAYLADSRGLTSYYPTDLKQRAIINKWLHWHHSNTRGSTNGILRPKFRMSGKEQEDAIAAGTEKFAESISFLDSELAKNAPETPFVAGTATPSIADLLLIPECDQLVGFGMFDFTPYPKVQEWMAAVKASVPAYDEVYAVVTATVARFAAKK